MDARCRAYTWFAKIIAVGELVIGIALILGAFTGLAAFSAGFLNWNFVMAGTASTNALLFAISTGSCWHGRPRVGSAWIAGCFRCLARPGARAGLSTATPRDADHARVACFRLGQSDAGRTAPSLGDSHT
jgi:hypothetical protein